MAFGGSLYGGSFTTNCLDDIPFKLGPKFKPPTKVVLPSDFHLISRSRALEEDYTFEVEEAVLKWSAEREKQRLELESNDDTDSPNRGQEQSNGNSADPVYANTLTQHLYENTSMLLPKPAPRPKVKPKSEDEYVNVLVPNPILANISNDILKPTPTVNSSETSETLASGPKPAAKTNDIDLTWFEKEDDPFDNLELQTINDLEELASVLEETKKVSPEPTAVEGNPSSNIAILESNGEQKDDTVNEQDEEDDDEDPNYENVELKLMDLKISTEENIYENCDLGSSLSDIQNLPPVPPRLDLIGGRTPPLPPIGQSVSEPAFPKTKNQSSPESNEQSNSSVSTNSSFQNSDNAKVISKRRVPLPKPPRTFMHNRPSEEENEGKVEEKVNGFNPSVSIAGAGNNFNVQFTNSQPTQDVSVKRQSSEDLKFVNQHFGENEASMNGLSRPPQPVPRKPVPPPRPTTQPWSRFSPLPPTPGSTAEQPSSVSLPSEAGNQQDLYSKLSIEAQTCVDRLVSMGFHKDRVARAVEKIGIDEKEVVEYLCLVDQLMEKGYNTYLSENALLLFKNSMKQACAYLELFTQLQELGFNREKIKEALVHTNNDREKTLDILTASS